MTSDEEPRSQFRTRILDALKQGGATPEVLEALSKALDDKTLDSLFVRTSASFTATSPSFVVKLYEAYFGPAATAFASRVEIGGGVQVHGNMLGGVVVGRDVSGKDVAVGGTTSSIVHNVGEIILQDLRTKSVNVTEGERLLREYGDASDVDRESRLSRFSEWAKRHAGELSANSLAALSAILTLLKQ